MAKTKEKKNNELKYEITMYKLLVIFAASIIITMGLGFYAGEVVGRSKGVDSVEVNVPEYCTINERGTNVTVSCLEFSNVTAGDLCKILSTPLENRIRVMILPS
jgi:hypothetical protein